MFHTNLAKAIRKQDIKVKEKIVKGKIVPEKYISNTTVNRDIEVLRKMFNFAIENNWISKNPCSSVKKLRTENKLERYLTADEEPTLLNSCVDEYEYLKDIILSVLNTGMRKGEVLGLLWKCVNYAERKITLLDTKNGKKRDIPINSVLWEILKRAEKVKCCEYVFFNPVTKTKYSDIKRAFKTVCKRANINNLRFHDLRHTAATRMLASGVPITTVQEILGHSDIRTTRRYLHTIKGYSLTAIETLATYVERNKKVA